MVEIKPLEEKDFDSWLELWKAYQVFYKANIPLATTMLTWQRFFDPTENMHAIGAFDKDGKLVGIVHAIFHRSCWLPGFSCYLQDLYVDSSQRGAGIGEKLIEAVAILARKQNAGKLYWMTQEDNLIARGLYEKIAEKSGFIQYVKPL